MNPPQDQAGIARHHSLRWRLPFVVSALIASVLATFLWTAHRAVETTLVGAAGARAQAAADQVASLLDARRSFEELRKVAAEDTLVRFLQTRSGAAHEAARTRLASLASTGPRRVELWDDAGERLLEISTPGPAAAGARVLPAASRPPVGGISELQVDGDIVFSDVVAEVVGPADQPAGGQRLGYVLVRSTFGVNPPGIIARLVGDDALVRVGNATGPVVWTDFSTATPALPVDLGRVGVARYERESGEIRFGAVSHVPATPWGVWVGFPFSTIIAPAQTFLNRMVLVGLVFLVVGTAFASIVSARITTPLSELSTAANAIASGDYAKRVANDRRDEIGQLGQAFNLMADQVHETQHRLEARVEERTAELKKARHAAERANQAKSDFLSRMSHELRTPLNAIMGFAQVLQLDPLAEEQMDGVKHILRGGRHLLSLINEVLDVARIEAGALSLSPEAVDVADIVQHAVDLIRPLALQRDLTIEVEPLPNVHVTADRQRLNQILLNLLSNAVKYNREHGTVRVSFRTSGGRVRIIVADTGAGIPPEKIELLFRPFERLGAEQSGVEGTGLGLALAKGLAEVMKGSLTVESVIDEGSTFTVELPITDGPARGEHPVTSQGVADRTKSGTILYIEDNLSNVSLMERLVGRRPGVELLHARDGKTGIEAVRTQRPNLVFLDLHLPDHPGEEVLRQLWSDPATRDIPVVVLTADATPAQKRRLLASGATAYLTKPFDIGEVLDVIDRTLRIGPEGEQ